MNTNYRPTVQDMTDSSKWQKLSLQEAHKFDQTKVRKDASKKETEDETETPSA